MSVNRFQSGLDELALKRLGRGCRRSQEQIYRDHANAAWALARRLTGCDASAWDVVQDAFVRVFGEIASLRDPAAFGGWLRRIVVHRAMDHHRSRRLEIAEAAPEAEQAAPDPAWLDLERALDRLDPTDRMVLWLHDAEGMTHEEIADLGGQTRSWSKSRLVRARSRMQRLLQARPEFLSLSAPKSTSPSSQQAPQQAPPQPQLYRIEESNDETPRIFPSD